MISRREFVLTLARSVSVPLGFGALSSLFWPQFPQHRGAGLAFAADVRNDMISQAPVGRYWTSVNLAKENCRLCHQENDRVIGKTHPHAANAVRCLLCAQACDIGMGKRGKCRSRQNVNGELRSLVYGRPVAVHTDPIEKKPFYHFLPGAAAFSLATTGCPLSCKWCSNPESQSPTPEIMTFDSKCIKCHRCVEACPTRALDAGPLEELRSAYGDCREGELFAYDVAGEPSVNFKPKRRPVKQD